MTERDEKEASAMNAMGESEDVRLGERKAACAAARADDGASATNAKGESEDVRLGERKAACANGGGAERRRRKERAKAGAFAGF
jgi:hypothetical protein